MRVPKKSRRKPQRLTTQSFRQAVRYLTNQDPELAEIVKKLGTPSLRYRQEGFHCLIHIILEQQVSLSSAKAAYDRLTAAATPLTPERFLQLSDTALKAFGFSRQKIAYCRNLAHEICKGRLDLATLGKMDDATARSELIRIKGIGNWTADIYLLTAMRRPDIWPAGDLALAVSIQRNKGLPHRPTPAEMDTFGAAWMPWRAVAARLLWHSYLKGDVHS